MTTKCKNHPEKDSISFCHSCGEYYCQDCLIEGPEFYYCKDEICKRKMQNDSLAYSEIDNAKMERKRSGLFYEYKKSKFPFLTFSMMIALIMSIKLGDFNNDIPIGIALFIGRAVSLWGVPFLVTMLIGLIITIKEIRSKLFYYAYFIIWCIIILLSIVGISG